MTPVEHMPEGPSALDIVALSLVLMAVGGAAGAAGAVVYLDAVGPAQCDALEAVTPETIRVYPPSPQASVDAVREEADVLERQRDVAEAALEACKVDRSMLMAVQGVQLPAVTVRGRE